MPVRLSLERWIADLDAGSYVEAFPRTRVGRPLAPVRDRFADYYLALVSELFDLLRDPDGALPSDWGTLANALADIATPQRQNLAASAGVSREDALLFGATAFTFGGFPASAYVVAQGLRRIDGRSEAEQACAEFLARPTVVTSRTVGRLLSATRTGDLDALASLRAEAATNAATALSLGPAEWIPATLLERLIDRYLARNVRAVLPDGGSDLWGPLVESFLTRRPPVWEFFPSQIQAIRDGLLTSADSYALQMPTGAGKTALTETLLFHHARTREGSAAVLIVPYRSLAAELRESIVRRLNEVGVPARSSYGGSVPIGDEIRDLDNLEVLVATPETLSGLIGASDAFYRRVSLVICDEGHLLDSGGRGVALELLLARLRARDTGAPRFVFVSAIVPNIEEINAWLGGRDETVVISDYKPAIAEFAMLHDVNDGGRHVELVLHPEEVAPTRFVVHDFLSDADFTWLNPMTGRLNTHPWTSIKAKSVAAARKLLEFGPVAIFSARKSGTQGAVGVAEELVAQVRHGISLPNPIDRANVYEVRRAHDYVSREFGAAWIGTVALELGAALHHGDIPQETREVLERLLRTSTVSFVICTTTLAEGVNLPIRTLVLYTTRRATPEGRPIAPLTRDIKNLVGRAGRPGSSTRGLVLCSNEAEWPAVRAVADQERGEPVHGALYQLLRDVRAALARQPADLDNETLEGTERLLPLIDGIDATLIDLATEEIGRDEFLEIARNVAAETFAYQQADAESSALLEQVFELRAEQVLEARQAGRIAWVRASGSRLRLAAAVANQLLPLRANWRDLQDPLDPRLVRAVLRWAWDQDDLRSAVRDAYRLDRGASVRSVRARFRNHVIAWLQGETTFAIATRSGQTVDDTMRVQTGAVAFALQTLVEQALALLEVAAASVDEPISPTVRLFAEHLRYGVPSSTGRQLASEGIRHRTATVALGTALEAGGGTRPTSIRDILEAALAALDTGGDTWRNRLGDLVLDNTRDDLRAALARPRQIQ